MTSREGPARRPRRRYLVLGILGLLLTVAIIGDAWAYPDYLAPICFDWEAKTGFKMISVVPPGRRLDFARRIYGGLVALQARPWVASEFRKWGWRSAKGQCAVRLLPFPPLVYGVDQSVEPWTIIDPEVTPLMQAAERDDLERVRALLASGANVNARDQRAWTALMHACMTRLASSEIVQTLIAAGADVNAKDRAGRTALIWAAKTGGGPDAEKKLCALLAAHANPNARSDFSETPLFEAVDMSSPHIVSELLAAGADPNGKATNGATPLSLAKAAGDAEMVRLLSHAGARQ